KLSANALDFPRQCGDPDTDAPEAQPQIARAEKRRPAMVDVLNLQDRIPRRDNAAIERKYPRLLFPPDGQQLMTGIALHGNKPHSAGHRLRWPNDTDAWLVVHAVFVTDLAARLTFGKVDEFPMKLTLHVQRSTVSGKSSFNRDVR